MAVADPARRRTRRPGPQSGPRRCDRRAGPDRGPRRDRRHRRPAPPPHQCPDPPAGRRWSAQLLDIADRDRRGYAAQIAAAMDARKDRIGEHAAGSALPWAVSALGPVPDHPVDRLEWQQRAASIGAYRELSGYAHPADPIGQEPATAAPDLRAAWHEALAALGPVDGPTFAACPTGHCCTCATPTPSKPAGRRNGPARNCARSGRRRRSPPGRHPRHRRSRHRPPPRPARNNRSSSRPWRPATRPCTTPTANARPSSPRS